MCLTEVASDSATLKMTAGDVNVSNSTLKDIILSMTAGNMYFSDCKIYGDNNIKMTAGELTMSLVGYRQDYRINVDKALGNVYIDGMDADGEYAESNAGTTALPVVQYDDMEITSEQEIVDKGTDNENPNGSIDINMTAGNCYIEFLGKFRRN